MRTGSIAIRVAGAAAVLVLAPATAAFAGDTVRATVDPAASAPGGRVEIRVVGCQGRSGIARSAAFAADARLSAKGGAGWLAGTTTVRPGTKPGTYGLQVDCDLQVHRDAGSVKVGGRAAGHEAPKHRTPEHRTPPKHDAPPRESPEHDAPQRESPKHDPAEGRSQPSGQEQRGSEPSEGAGHKPAEARPRAPEHRSQPPKDERHEGEPDRTSPQRPHRSPVAPVSAGGGGAPVLASPLSTGEDDDTGPSTSQTVLGLVLAGGAAVAVVLRSARRRRRTDSD